MMLAEVYSFDVACNISRPFTRVRLFLEFVVLLLFLVNSTDGESMLQFLESPSNTAVLTKGSTTLKCSVKSDLENATIFHWQFTPCDSSGSGKGEIYNGMEINTKLVSRTRFVVSNSMPGQRHLSISYIRASDAGLYECKIILDGGKYKTSRAELIVLESHPRCSGGQTGPLNEGDVIRYQTSVSFRGNLNLTMHWSDDDGRIVTSPSVESITAPRDLSSSLTLKVNSTHNGARFTCHTSFKPHVWPADDHATNVPDYDIHRCVFPVLNITYGPKLVTITPRRAVYNPGDNITCTAEANPYPRFYWIDTDKKTKLNNGSIFEIRDSMVDPSTIHGVVCIAWNEDGRGGIWNGSSQISFAVQAKPGSDGQVLEITTSTLITISVAALSGVLLVGVACLTLAYFILGRGRNSKGNQRGRKTSETDNPSVDSTVNSDHTYDSMDPTTVSEAVSGGQVSLHPYANIDLHTTSIDAGVEGGELDQLEAVEINLVSGNLVPETMKQAQFTDQGHLYEFEAGYQTSYTEFKFNGRPPTIYSALKPNLEEKTTTTCCCN